MVAWNRPDTDPHTIGYAYGVCRAARPVAPREGIFLSFFSHGGGVDRISRPRVDFYHSPGVKGYALVRAA